MQKIFVLDTNVLLNDPYSILAFNEHKVVIPMTVLEELDHIKGKHIDVSRDARVAIRQINDVIGDASHQDILNGVKLSLTQKGVHEDGLLAIVPDYINVDLCVDDVTVPDNRIINVALYYQSHYEAKCDVVLVTDDINLKIKAKAAGVTFVESYKTNESVTDAKLLHKGFIEIKGSFWDLVQNVESSVTDKKSTVHKIEIIDELKTVIINDYIVDEANTMLKVQGKSDTHLYLKDIGTANALNRKAWGIKSKNVYQAMAMNSLMDKDTDLLVLLGPAGTGKTLLSVAAGLEQTLEKKSRKFDKVVFTRTMDSQFAEIGFLPGTETDKTKAWCGAAQDAIEYLHKDDADPKKSIEYIEDNGIFQYKALTFIRGRSFKDTMLIVDEAQNLTPTMVKTIITRLAEGSKVIVMGNLAQIDNQYISPNSSGLTYLVEKLKGQPGVDIVQLQDSVRSRLAEIAERLL
jgi:PhoH-like ATPase